MKSLSKKNIKKNTKKRLGKSKKHNKSKKTHKKSKKQQKGGFVINEYVGIENIPETATMIFKILKIIKNIDKHVIKI